MNRSLALVGLILVVVSILLVSIPFLVTSAFQVNDALYATGFLFLVGLVILFQAATSPDPAVTTVGGILGNPVVDQARKAEEAVMGTPPRHVRYAPGPREPANCRYCYTLIPWNILNCPRCARPRHCRGCGKQLYFLAGAVRCGPCVRDESQCNCPRVRPVVVRPAGMRSIGGGP